ncbi:hypothetical protein [Micromonospora sediminimaris]|uniref:Secreted protein n=1 Tax=Micromonospora sediminimaris TaxID=547162 RepID=A0A9W5XME3_9ACTN|nr:hypothetical protein [Micromonospora sediminimaris]GIJ34698.1 hypothetical protein Vse01_38460 [Micromonospora sediminimaris]SFB81931.1 hypothetical protein SAMN05216284_101218 [Micromonospora sediminimaris]
MTATDHRPGTAAGQVEGASQPGRPRPDPVPPGGTAWRYAAATLVLGLTLTVGFFAGRAGAPTSGPTPQAASTAHLGHGPGGLEVSRDGWTLALDTPSLTAGRPGELAFRITDAAGAALTTFQENHERRMHLILVGRDLSGYQHVHPEMSADGTWRVTVTPTAPGPLRAIADFWPQGAPAGVTLGVDVPVPGRYASGPLAPPEETILVDGYTVTLDGGLRAGESNQVLVWLGHDGQPVNDLQRHLGAYGHLVALRQGDLAYLHVHPAAASQPSSVVAFGVTVPSAGTYRLFFEFRHLDEVRVAAFTVVV